MRHICARLIDTSERVATQQWPPRTHFVCVCVCVCVCVWERERPVVIITWRYVWDHLIETCPDYQGTRHTGSRLWTIYICADSPCSVTADTVTLEFIDIWINQHNQADISVNRRAPTACYCNENALPRNKTRCKERKKKGGERKAERSHCFHYCRKLCDVPAATSSNSCTS